MRPARILLAGLAVLLVAALALGIAALDPRLQTWAVRRALGARPGLGISVGRVAAGFGTIEIDGLRIERGGAVLSAPSIRAEFSPGAALRREAAIRSFTAVGWTLDLSRARLRLSGLLPSSRVRARAAPRGWPAAARASAPPAPALGAPVFNGVLDRLRLPFDLRVDAAGLDGEVVLAPAPGWQAAHLHLAVSGGGLRAGGEGRFDFSVRASPAGGPVDLVDLDGAMAVAMDTPRTFSRLAVRADASAAGGQLPSPVRLSVDLATVRTADGEDTTLSLAGRDRRLAVVHEDFSARTGRISGTWFLDLGDEDLSPFAFGRALPAFAAAGSGDFETDAAWRRVVARGRLNANADRLGVVRPELEALGALRLTADFSLAWRSGELRVERLAATLAGARPLLSVRALQAFDFNAETGELKVADPSTALVGITLTHFPVDWLHPLLPAGWAVSAAGLDGSLVAQAGSDGVTVRPKGPLTARGLSLARRGEPYLQDVDVSLTASADDTPHGWQATFASGTAGRNGAVFAGFELRIGRLAGPGQPMKAEGSVRADLKALLAQPLLAGLRGAVGGGTLSADYEATLGERRSVRATLAFDGLSLRAGARPSGFSTLRAGLRADFEPSGGAVFRAPLSWNRNGAGSDLELAGVWSPGGPGGGLEIQAASGRLDLADAGAIGGLLAWASAHGVGGEARIAFDCRRLDGAPVPLSGLGGVVRLAPGGLALQGWRVQLGQAGAVRLDGLLGPAPDDPGALSLRASLSARGFDPGPFWKAVAPGSPPPVEGRFDVAAQVATELGGPGGWRAGLRGRLQLDSTGGVFRLLRTDVAGSVRKSPSLLSDFVNAFGTLIGHGVGKSDEARRWLDKQGKAVVEIADGLGDIHYDQFDLAADLAPGGVAKITQCALIAPELRIEGTGSVGGAAGAGLSGQPVAIELRLGARGATAELMGEVGLLGDRKDDLGYTRCSEPVELGGTLGRVDDGQWRSLLIRAAARKAAGGLLRKLF